MALSWSAVTGDDAGLAAGLLSLHERGRGIEQDQLVAGLADAAVRRNLTATQGDAGKR